MGNLAKENSQFQEKQEMEGFVAEHGGNPACLECTEKNVLKKTNVVTEVNMVRRTQSSSEMREDWLANLVHLH